MRGRPAEERQRQDRQCRVAQGQQERRDEAGGRSHGLSLEPHGPYNAKPTAR